MISIKLHPYLRKYTDNREIVNVEGETIRDCLEDLCHRYPEIEEHIFKEGELNPEFEVFVKAEDAYHQADMETPAQSVKEIILITVPVGG
jgi:molybdopterin converting factor small subunit